MANRYIRKKHRRELLDSGCCTYCNSPNADTIDHILAVANGGNSRRENLIPACRKCNSTKSDKSLDWFSDNSKMKREKQYKKCLSIIKKIRKKKWSKNYDRILVYDLTFNLNQHLIEFKRLSRIIHSIEKIKNQHG